MTVNFLISRICLDPIRKKPDLNLPLRELEYYSEIPKATIESNISWRGRFHGLSQYYINCHLHSSLHLSKRSYAYITPGMEDFKIDMTTQAELL